MSYISVAVAAASLLCNIIAFVIIYCLCKRTNLLESILSTNNDRRSRTARNEPQFQPITQPDVRDVTYTKENVYELPTVSDSYRTTHSYQGLQHATNPGDGPLTASAEDFIMY